MKYETARKHAERRQDAPGGAIMLADHHAQTIPAQPGQYDWKKLASICVAVAALFYGASRADATPIWELLTDWASSPFIIDTDVDGDWEGVTALEPYNGQYARIFVQQIKNISDDGEELKSYTFPAGSGANSGQVIHAWRNDDVLNDEDTLTLDINDVTLHALAGYYIGVNDTITYKQVTLDTTASDDSTGYSKGLDDADEPFPDLEVNIPAIPEPATLSLLAVGFLSVLGRGRLGGRPGKNSRNTSLPTRPIR